MPAPFLGGIESRDPSREVPRDRQFSAAVPPSLGKREKPSVRRQCRVSRACPPRFFARSTRPRAAISFLLADFSVTLAGHGYALKIHAARGRPGDQHGGEGVRKGRERRIHAVVREGSSNPGIGPRCLEGTVDYLHPTYWQSIQGDKVPYPIATASAPFDLPRVHFFPSRFRAVLFLSTRVGVSWWLGLWIVIAHLLRLTDSWTLIFQRL